MGLTDVDGRRSTSTRSQARIAGIEARLRATRSAGCSRARACGIDHGHRPARRARTRSWPTTADGTEELEADAILLSTGSRPRIPDWAHGRRRAGAHHPRRLPAAGDARAPRRDRLRRHRRGVRPHVHARSAAEVTLIVSPPAGAARRRTPRSPPRSRTIPRAGACACSRAPGPSGIDVDRRRASRCAATTAASPTGSHALLAIGSIPNSEGLGPRRRRASTTDGGYVAVDQQLPHQRAAHLRRRRPVGEAAAVVGGVDAGPQDRRARDGPAQPGRTATSTTTRRPRPSSPSPRSPTSAWPRPTPSPRAARSGSPRCRSRHRPRRSSRATRGAS